MPRIVSTVLALAAILGMALAMRLADLEGARSSFPDLFDEGIRAEQLFLMSRGFRPYRDIYAAQGPLLLDTLYPAYRLFGETVGAIRLGVGMLSIVGLVGVFLAARQAGGNVGGVLACGLLALSPSYLEGSRLALAEVPSIAPAALAVALAGRYGQGASRRWLVASAVLFGVGLLIKPMVIPAAVPIGLFVLARRDGLCEPPGDSAHRRRVGPGRIAVDLALCVLVVGVLTIVIVAMMGPRDVFEQLVLYRAGATGASGWEARASWKEAVQGPIMAQPSQYLLAAAGAVLLLLAAPRAGMPLVAWPLATFALLFFYTPLHPKHLVYLAPPVALLAGAGLGVAWRLVAQGGAGGRAPAVARAALAVGGVALLGWDLVAVQPALARGVQPVVDEDDPDLHVFDDEAAHIIGALVGPDEFVLTDHPYIAFLARRMVPPELVDPSRGRARAGTLTEEVATRSAEDRDAGVVLFWADRLRRLGKLDSWVERRYVPVASFGTRVARNKRGKDRTVYLRREADLAAAKRTLVGLLARPLAVDFSGDMRLLGVTVTRAEVEPGEPLAVSTVWEAIRDLSTNYHVMLSLVGPDGQAYSAQEQDIEGTADGTKGWRAGAWLFRSFMLVPEAGAPRGEYLVVVGLDDTRGGRPAPITANPDGLAVPRPEAPGRVIVGSIQVR